MHLLSDLAAPKLSESVTTLAFWASWSQIIGAAAAVVLALWAILIARKQLNDAKRSAFGQFILGIDEAFRGYEKVRRYINRQSSFPKPYESDMYRYIGIFERLGIFIKWKLLPTKTVDELYGHRFQRLISYEGGFSKDYGREFPPRAHPENWDGFISLWRALKDLRDVGKPPPESPGRKKADDDEPEVTSGSSRPTIGQKGSGSG